LALPPSDAPGSTFQTSAPNTAAQQAPELVETQKADVKVVATPAPVLRDSSKWALFKPWTWGDGEPCAPLIYVYRVHTVQSLILPWWFGIGWAQDMCAQIRLLLQR
jgi:hypothetical protein